MGMMRGSSSSPNTVERMSSPAALHLRRFHRFTSSPSLSLPESPCVLDLHAHRLLRRGLWGSGLLAALKKDPTPDAVAPAFGLRLAGPTHIQAAQDVAQGPHTQPQVVSSCRVLPPRCTTAELLPIQPAHALQHTPVHRLGLLGTLLAQSLPADCSPKAAFPSLGSSMHPMLASALCSAHHNTRIAAV